jgi:hypothetical protein
MALLTSSKVLACPSITRRFAILCLVSVCLPLSGCGVCCDFFGLTGGGGDSQSLCRAVSAESLDDFEAADYDADFDQAENDHPVFLFTSAERSAGYDGINAIRLDYARVEFDYEDSSVDTVDLGGFLARWRLLLVPATEARILAFENATSLAAQETILADYKVAPDRVEVQIPGPYEGNGCEWGDTDKIETQSLTYLDYGIYDWDFFPDYDRILGVVFEGDEGIGDDVIALIDIAQGDPSLVFEREGRYRLEFDSEL